MPPANIITLSYACISPFVSFSNVKTDPDIKGCPNLFPKSEAPLDAFIKISNGV